MGISEGGGMIIDRKGSRKFDLQKGRLVQANQVWVKVARLRRNYRHWEFVTAMAKSAEGAQSKSQMKRIKVQKAAA